MKKFVFVALATLLASNAQGMMFSTTSLTLLCGPQVRDDTACATYLQGIVETWQIKDLVSLDPPRYHSQNSNAPTACNAIGLVDGETLVQIIRSNLNQMDAGLAAINAMNVLHREICQ